MRLKFQKLEGEAPVEPTLNLLTHHDKRPRTTRGRKLATAAREGAAEVGSIAIEWDATDALPVPEAGAGGTLPERAGYGTQPWAAAEAAQEQRKWDHARPHMQRSHVEHLPLQRQLAQSLSTARKQAMEQQLAEVRPHCSICHSDDVRHSEAAQVLYVGIEDCFELDVPCYSCCQADCCGDFAPSPFAVCCFPATAKVSWNVVLSGPGKPARWFDMRLLQLADSLIFQSGRSAAVYGFAAAIHSQHDLNGSGGLLGWEHFKRQLGEAILVMRWSKVLLGVMQHNLAAGL